MQCSVVAATYNGLAYTRLFVESVLQCTDRPYELILVDDGSTDDTPAYLEALAREHSHVTVIRHERNQGIGQAWNRGVAAARGRYIAVCNNDLVVSPGWLGRLVDELIAREHHGVVCAASNQVVWSYYPELFPDEYAFMKDKEAPPGPSWESLQAFYGDFFGWAKGFEQKHAEVRIQTYYMPCLVARREVFEEIGGFDESFGQAFYQDIDFFARVLLSSRYNLIEIYGGVFVHHFVGATVIPLGVARLMTETGVNFVHKWRAITGERDWMGEYHTCRLDREGLLRLRAEVLDRLPVHPALWG